MERPGGIDGEKGCALLSAEPRRVLVVAITLQRYLTSRQKGEEKERMGGGGRERERTRNEKEK